MLTFLNKYAKNLTYSQNGEEGILLECLIRFTDLNYRCCEFGANNGDYCSNTMKLVDNGYEGYFIESDHRLFSALWGNASERCKKGQRIHIYHSEVNKENVNAFVPENIDVLSIDTDGDNDYDCFDALEKRPKIVIIEINSGIKPDIQGRKDAYLQMVCLGIEKDYFLLCHTGNLIFVDNKYRYLFPEIIGNGIENSNEYFNKSWLS